MSAALDNGLEVTALHNHFVWDSPKIMFVHIGCMGPEQDFAAAVGLGADNFMWSTDYPHQAATWPHTMEVLARDFAPLPEADRRKIVRENCARVYGFSLPG